MSNTLKCPNPSCPYAFDPSQVPTGVVLSCPRCSTQFTLGPPTAAPTGYTSGPSNHSVAPTPDESEFEVVGRTAIDERDPDEPLPGRATGRYQGVILVGIVAVLLAGSALAIIAKLMRRDDTPTRVDTFQRDPDRNIGYDPLPTGWNPDDTTRLKVKSPYTYGFKRENPEAYVVFGSEKYDGGRRSPRPSELRRDLVAPLQRLFITVEEELPSDTAWLGQPIGPRLGLKFRARSSDELVWQGEAYTVTYKGLAYFWVGWCGESDFDGLKAEFAAFRGKFKLLDQRNDWRETVANQVDYKGATVPYTFTDAEDIWKEESIEEHKPGAPDLDRWLRINHTPRADRKAIPEEADLRIYLIDGGGDPLKRARDYVEDYWVNRLKDSSTTLPPPTFTELTGEAQGDQSAKGSTPVVRLESRVVDPDTKKVIAASESRLIVVSGARVGDKTVVMHCWCDLSKREVFESRFVQIASSLR